MTCPREVLRTVIIGWFIMGLTTSQQIVTYSEDTASESDFQAARDTDSATPSPSTSNQLPGTTRIRNRRDSYSSDEQQDTADDSGLDSAFLYNDQIMQNLLRTQSPRPLHYARSSFFLNLLKPRTTRVNPWDDHSLMHFGKRSVRSGQAPRVKRSAEEWSPTPLLHFENKSGPESQPNGQPLLTQEFENFGVQAQESAFSPGDIIDIVQHQGNAENSDDTVNVGKKSDSPWDSSTLHFGKKDEPWHSMMSFGKKSDSPWDSSTLHFGKKDEPWHSMMSFGKRSDSPWDSNTLHFGKRDDPWHSMMSFGKRSDSPWDSSTLHFGKRDEPWHNIMSFGKKSDNPWVSSTLHFGKKDEPWHNMMSFGKRSGNPWESSTLHFGKRDDPWHSMMSFGKKSDNPWDSSTLHFGKRGNSSFVLVMPYSDYNNNDYEKHFSKRSVDTWEENKNLEAKNKVQNEDDGSSTDIVGSPNFNSGASVHLEKRDPWDNHNTMHFGKREPWGEHNTMHFGKREPWGEHNTMHFGKREPWGEHNTMHFGKREPWDEHNTMHFGKREPWGEHNTMHFGKREPWDEHNTMHFGKREPWGEHNTMHFGKREPWGEHNTMHFGKREPWDEHNTMHFGKREPWGEHNTMHFGKREPWGEHNTMHFGKREPWGEHNTMHFGKREPWGEHNTMHFGKRDGQSGDQTLSPLNAQNIESENEHKMNKDVENINKNEKQIESSAQESKTKSVHKRSINVENSLEKDEKQHKKNRLRSKSEEKGNNFSKKPKKENIKNLKGGNKYKLSSNRNGEKKTPITSNVDGIQMRSDSPKESKNFNSFDKRKSHTDLKISKVNDIEGYKTERQKRSIESATVKKIKESIQSESNTLSENTEPTLRVQKRSIHPEDDNDFSNEDKRYDNLWGYHNTMHFGKKSDPWESYTLHFGKRPSSLDSYSAINFGNRDAWDHSTMHFGKRDPFDHNTMHFGKRDPFDHNTMHFGKRDPFDHNTMHFGKRDPFDHNTMHFGKRNDDTDMNVEDPYLETSHELLEENIRNLVNQVNKDFPGETVSNRIRELEKILLYHLRDKSLTFPEKYLLLRNFLQLVLGKALSDQENGGTVENEDERYLNDDQNNDVMSDDNLLFPFANKLRNKRNYISGPELKRYFVPFQGPKSFVYPHAWFASQIRRSAVPRSSDYPRSYELRMAEKKEDPFNSYMHFGRR